MKRMKLAMLCAIGILPLAGNARGQSTQPSMGPGIMDPRPFGGGFGGRWRGFGFGGGRRQEPPNAVEWEDMLPFMSEHSPERLKVVTHTTNEQRQNQLKMALARNYWNVQQIRVDQPDLVPLILNRIELEDQIFKLVNQIKVADRRNDSKASADSKQALQQKIGELLDTNIKERQIRLSKLQQSVQEEQQRLNTDTHNRDQLVGNRMRVFLDGTRADAAPLDDREQSTLERAKPSTQP